MEKIFRMSEKKLLKYLARLLVSKQYQYENVIKTKDYVYAEGNIPVMLVAHLDTVHASMPTHIFHDKNQNVLWSPEGLGADDRAGVWAILQLITAKQKPYILFTTQEEVGGKGASIVIKEIIEAPPVNMLIEFDRKGHNDAVFYDCDNPEFTSYIEKYGFVKNYGSFSDISIICPAWGIAGVNLSSGYYNAHTKNEYLNLDELNDVIRRVRNMFNSLPSKQFEYIEEVKFYGKYGSYYGKWGESDAAWGKEQYWNYFKCTECGITKSYFEESTIRDVCKTCFDDVFKIPEKQKPVISITKYQK